jgi:hypothetical protein
MLRIGTVDTDTMVTGTMDTDTADTDTMDTGIVVIGTLGIGTVDIGTLGIGIADTEGGGQVRGGTGINAILITRQATIRGAPTRALGPATHRFGGR